MVRVKHIYSHTSVTVCNSARVQGFSCLCRGGFRTLFREGKKEKKKEKRKTSKLVSDTSCKLQSRGTHWGAIIRIKERKHYFVLIIFKIGAQKRSCGEGEAYPLCAPYLHPLLTYSVDCLVP